MPVMLDQTVSVKFNSEDLTRIDARCVIFGCTRSHFIRAKCLSEIGGTEYHLHPKTGEKGRPPPITAEVIEELKKINEMDNDLSVKLRLWLGLRREFVHSSKAGALQKLNEMIPEKGVE